MIDDPLSKVEAFVGAGADMITFHLEGARQPHRVLQVLGSAVNANDAGRGLIRGVGLNPSTPVEPSSRCSTSSTTCSSWPINPGLERPAVHRLDRAATGAGATPHRIVGPARSSLGVDGGVTHANIARVAAMGADIIVSGSAIFDGGDVTANAAAMLDAVAVGPSAAGPRRSRSGSRASRCRPAGAAAGRRP